MEGHDKHFLFKGRLGAENWGALLLHYSKWKAYVVKSVLGRGLWGKEKRNMNRAHSGVTFAKSK